MSAAGASPFQPGDPAMQPTRNTLSENIHAQSVGLLNKHLAVAIDQQLWLVESDMAPQ
jgi:hypothetical protein